MIRGAILALSLALAACGGGGDPVPVELKAKPHAAPASLISAWQQAADIPGACCNYAALVFQDDDSTVVYTNSTGTLDGKLQRWVGGQPTAVLSIDVPRDSYIRTLGVTRTPSGYAAILFTGDGYPTQGGYSPSWATSTDGKTDWVWHGPAATPFGRVQSSAGALVFDGYAFRMWMDVGGKLWELHSVDGMTWAAMGAVELPVGKLWASAAMAPSGIMLSVAEGFPTTRISTLWKCANGGQWTVLEADAQIRNGDKGTALTYAGGLFHAYANGKHWTRKAPECAEAFPLPGVFG